MSPRQHVHELHWYKGRLTKRFIEVCYGKFGLMEDFHVVQWPGEQRELEITTEYDSRFVKYREEP